MDTETRDKALKFLNEIAEQINGAVVDTGDRLKFDVVRDGITAHSVLWINEIRSGAAGDWNRQPTGRLSFRVENGRYRSIKTYRELKNGSYNPALIDEINRAARACIGKEKSRLANKAAAQVATDALGKFGLAASMHLHAGSSYGNPIIKVSFEIRPIFLAATVKFMRFIGALDDDQPDQPLDKQA